MNINTREEDQSQIRNQWHRIVACKKVKKKQGHDIILYYENTCVGVNFAAEIVAL